MRKGSAVYTIMHLMMLTFVIALFSMAVTTDSPWWRATLMTMDLCLFLNAIIAAIICRETKQAFALGYAVSSCFFLLSLYTLAGIETLPLLITQTAWSYIAVMSDSPPSEDHFYTVALLFWAFVCAYGGGLLAARWYNKRMRAEAAISDLTS